MPALAINERSKEERQPGIRNVKEREILKSLFWKKESSPKGAYFVSISTAEDANHLHAVLLLTSTPARAGNTVDCLHTFFNPR